jgi:hypothetical protein
MTETELEAALRTLTLDDLRRIGTALAAGSVGDEVDAWRATMAIDRTLRCTHRTRRAAHAARDAAQAVQHAAQSSGVPLPDPVVTCVARAASELARGIVAGPAVEREMLQLLSHWVPLLARV